MVCFIVILLMPVIPTCLGALTSFLFLTFFPPAQAKAFVTVGGAVLGSAFYLSQEIIWSSHASVNLTGATAALHLVNNGWLAALPPSWPATALGAELSGQPLVGGRDAGGSDRLNGAIFLGALERGTTRVQHRLGRLSGGGANSVHPVPAAKAGW